MTREYGHMPAEPSDLDQIPRPGVEKKQKPKMEFTWDQLMIFRSIRGVVLEKKMPITEILGIRLNSGPLEVWIDGKKYLMDTSKGNFGEILGESQYQDSERMNIQEAEAEARLIEFYAERLHHEHTKELLYPNQEISTKEYQIAEEFLKHLDKDKQKSLILKTKAFFYKSIFPHMEIKMPHKE